MGSAGVIADNEIHILFRYRDLIAPTIEEHAKIVAAREGCWWGWWKRPNEDARSDVWTILEQTIADRGEAFVGLFDSGASEPERAVRVARVLEVRRPIQDGAGAWACPPLEAHELELVPEYYRASPFSRAWLRIAQFSDAVPFFQKYSFDIPPPLPGIPEVELKRLAAKVVKDSDELRAMDTTVWRVRRRLDSDSDERFLASSTRFSSPFERHAAVVSGEHILHLSDLHFSVGDHRAKHVWSYTGEPKAQTLVDAISRALDDEKANVGVLVVSGDLTFRADSKEFDLAFASLSALMGRLDIGADQVVVLPGNHDICFTKDPGEAFKEAVVPTLSPADAEAGYRAFYQKLLRHDSNEHLSMGRRYVFPCGLLVEFCALNSNSLETGKRYLPGIGRVGDGAFENAAGELDWKGSKGRASLKILAMHHHLTLTEDIEDPAEYGTGFGMAIDAKRVLREAARRGVHLVLHGHRHRSFVWRSTVYELPEENQAKWRLGEVSILGAGSCGSTDVRAGNCFNLVRVGSDGLQATVMRSRSRGDFKALQTWRAQFSLTDGSLGLSEWAHLPGEPRRH